MKACNLKVPSAPVGLLCGRERGHPGRCEVSDPVTARRYTYPSPADWEGNKASPVYLPRRGRRGGR
jgi:hypothetical protein